MSIKSRKPSQASRLRLLASAVVVASTLCLPATAKAESAPALFHTGLWTFAGGYVPSVVVAVVSPRSFDKALYVPVVGPWIDLASRDCDGCRHETLNKVLLVGGGVLQAVGAIQILGALFFGERREYPVARSQQPFNNISIGPAQFSADGYGAVARGSF